ncbi:MAG: RNA methyltransferase [Balneolales bacterium]|nr:RNA methyltransferase [Balneolales bacterium]
MNTPLSKAQTSRFRKLRQRKYREELGLFIAEGLRTVEQVVKLGKVRVEAVVVDAAQNDRVISEIGTLLAQVRVPVFVADSQVFADLCDTEQSQGVLAVCDIPPEMDIAALKSLSGGFFLATDGIQDPGNLGTLYRTAAWFGAVGILLGAGTVDLFNPKVVRSTVGAIGVLPWLRMDLVDGLGILRGSGWDVALLDVGEGAEELGRGGFAPKSVIVVGNEANGISSDLVQAGFRRVFIPGQSDNVESLNASVAGAVAMYEISSVL